MGECSERTGKQGYDVLVSMHITNTRSVSILDFVFKDYPCLLKIFVS